GGAHADVRRSQRGSDGRHVCRPLQQHRDAPRRLRIRGSGWQAGTRIVGGPDWRISGENMGSLHPVQVIAVTGGKGGVGKTSVSVNLALALADLGRRVMLLDADL